MAITTAWALGVFVGVVVAGPYSGAHLNPAVTIGLAIGGSFPVNQILSYIVAQLLGAAVGAALVWLMYKDHFDATDDPATKLGVFCTGPAIPNKGLNFLSEVVGTFALMFVVFYITDGELTYGSNSTIPIGLGSVGAIPVSFTVWVIGLALGGTPGSAITQARGDPRGLHPALPPRSSDRGRRWDYAWIPVVGPLVGAALAGLLYDILHG